MSIPSHMLASHAEPPPAGRVTHKSSIAANWTEDRVELLKGYWIKGFSASQCARLLGGCTRNAVIGKVSRLGLAGRPNPSKPSLTRAPRPTSPRLRAPKVKRAASQNNGLTFQLKAGVQPTVCDIPLPAKAFSPLPDSAPRLWITRQANECCWPIDGEAGTFLSCCLPKADDRYCATHRVLSAGKERTPNEAAFDKRQSQRALARIAARAA